MQENVYSIAGNEIVKNIGKRYKSYRKQMKLSQKEVSERSGLSIFTVSSFENGSQTGLSLLSFTKLLRAIDCLEEIEKLLPELPESPSEIFKKMKNR
jgi:transcriptional regulator with XRE-family HTH domain